MLNTFWWYVFHLCELFGYDDKSFNKKMHSMLGSTIKYIPVLLKDDTRSKKERIALSILLISPKYYNKLFGGKKHGKE